MRAKHARLKFKLNTLFSWLLACYILSSCALANTVDQAKILGRLSNKHATVDQFRVHGLAKFSKAQQSELREWLSFGVNATRATLGIYPKPLDLYIYPRSSNQPVPWAHTRRDEPESVYFYVDTRFSTQQFIDDWTIYHELAHLAIPYVGENYAWFSEGFASFMQYQIMAHAGLLERSLTQVYSSKISPQLRWFQTDISPAAMASGLMKKRNYPAAYWGGAYFFVLIEQQLRAKDYPPLIQLIEQYQQAGREQDVDIHDLLTSLDNLINDSLFIDLLKQFEQQPAKTLYPVKFSAL